MHNDIYNRWMAKQIDWRICKHIEKSNPKDILGCLIWLQYSLSDATLQLNQHGQPSSFENPRWFFINENPVPKLDFGDKIYLLRY